MSNLAAMPHDALATIGAASLLYTGTVAATALTALLSSSPTRRRTARHVLTILLTRHDPHQ